MLAPHEVADEEDREQFYRAFCDAAKFQGRFAYCLMSIHAVNPSICQYFTDYDPEPLLYYNMIYGISIMIVCRPSLMPLIPGTRFTFSLLASLAFNYSSLCWFQGLRHSFEGRPYLATFLGYLTGRIFMVHLIAFLYHIDTRCTEPNLRIARDPDFEVMYI